jgi:anti-sigma-K factor RskA
LDCQDRKDLILLYAAGALDEGESAELRQHLAGGCPQCAGYYAEAEAVLGLLPLSLPPQSPSPVLRQSVLNRARSAIGPGPMRIWDRMVLSAAIAAVLAVAVTLAVVNQFWPRNKASPVDPAAVADLRTQLILTQGQLAAEQQELRGLKCAELTGPAQPDAVGRVFIDQQMNKWYFFTCGMKPAAGGKTYELWLICNNQKIPAGTFDVSQQGTATLLGSVPPLPAGATVSLAVTDEPVTGPHEQPTGHLQIQGIVE